MYFRKVTTRNPSAFTRGPILVPWATDSFKGMGQRRPFSDIGDETAYEESRNQEGSLVNQILKFELLDTARGGFDA
jgi:hypothetical protein